jgi:hypothetical protein
VTVRFLADEDLHGGLMEGLLSREPAIDVLDVKSGGLRGMTDPALLELASQEGRILVTHDRGTMVYYFRQRLDAGQPSSGIFVIPQRAALREVIDSLLLVWTASQSEEWRNQIVYLPFR